MRPVKSILGKQVSLHTAQWAIRVLVDRLARRCQMDSDARMALLGLPGEIQQATAHADIVPDGFVSDHVFLVLDGLAARFSQVSDGRRHVTAMHIPGDLAGVPGIVAPGAAWPLQAVASTIYLRVPVRSLRDCAARHAAVAHALWYECSREASILSNWLVNVGRRNARERLAHLLCELSLRHEWAGTGTRMAFRLDASQADLGEALGLTSVHVNRTLGALRSAGLVIAANRRVQILDWLGLAELADFDPAYLLPEGETPVLAEERATVSP